MTIEQRLDQLEQQNHRIERKNKRLTAALTLTVVAMCAAVTMAATGEKDGVFDLVTARYIMVKNDAGEVVVALDANDGSGLVLTRSAKGEKLVELGSTVNGDGVVYAGNRKGTGRELKPGP